MKTKPYQFRINAGDPREAELLKKIQKASEETGLSMNTLVNLAVSAGLPTAVKKIKEIHEPAKAA